MLAQCSDLGQMGDAQDLLFQRKGKELFPHFVGRPAADAGVDLIEDQRAHRVCPAEYAFDGQHNAGKFAARSHFVQRFQRFPRVRGQQEDHVVGAAAGEFDMALLRRALHLDAKTGVGHIQLMQLLLDPCRQILGRTHPPLVQRLG